MARAEYTYKIPPRIAEQAGMVEFVLVELTAEEEMMASRRSRNDAVRLMWELPKEALRAVDGRRMSSADGSVDKTWNEMHPKARALIMQAYQDLHQPAADEVSAFLGSRQVAIP